MLRSQHVIGTLSLDSEASVTALRAGPDFVIAVGLCGRLRAWRAAPCRAVVLTLACSEEGRVKLRLQPVSCTADWLLVLDESSVYELANKRQSSHPFRFLSEVMPDGRFAAATPSPTEGIQIWETRRWQRLQRLDPAAAEGHRDEWMQRGINSVRSACSSIALSTEYLACGSREGALHLWRVDAASGDRELQPHRRGLRGDVGPVASVVIAGEIVVAAYRQSDGLVDGNAFSGEGRLVGWELRSGAKLWALPAEGHPPLLAAVSCGAQLWLIHAHPSVADADWNLVFAAPPAECAQRALGCLVRSAPLLRHSEGIPPPAQSTVRWQGLHETPLGMPVLAWHSDGDAIALGFCGGHVGIVMGAGEEVAASPHQSPAASAVLVRSNSADGSDIAAVLLHTHPEAAGDVHLDSPDTPRLLYSASASGAVCTWAVARGGGGASDLLQLRACIRLPSSRQPSSLAFVGRSLICGCTEGALVELHASELRASELSAACGGGGLAAATAAEADSAMGRREAAVKGPPGDDGATRCGGEVPGQSGQLSSGAKACPRYNWRFDSGAGAQARGRLEERRRYFDGWAQTAAYERGLQQVLAKMDKQRGVHDCSDTSGAVAAKAAPAKAAPDAAKAAPDAARAAVGPALGTLYKLDGLQARPELNGCVGVTIGPLDQKTGRVAFRLLPSAERPSKGDLKVRLDNLLRLSPAERQCVSIS